MIKLPTYNPEPGDIPVRAVWIGCIALYVLYLIAALALPHEVLLQGPARHPVTGEPNWEFGLLETTQNLFLAAALIMAGVMCARATRLLLRVWLALVFIGLLYLLGEETSWGQHYFRWGTDGWFAEFNDQAETNLHNTSHWFDQVPRNFLYLGMIVGGLIHPLLKLYRNGRGLIDQPWWWAPTLASLPTVVFAFLGGAPKAIDKFVRNVADLTGQGLMGPWADGFRLETFVGRASEWEECFMYLFFVIYLWSLASRLKFRSDKHG